MSTIAAILVAIATSACAQLLVPPPVQYVQQQQVVETPNTLAHRAVVLNAEAESHLPPELLNPFYKNPRIAEGLAKESWLTNKEMPVFDRAAEKIPRSEIYKLVHHAGFVDRRRR